MLSKRRFSCLIRWLAVASVALSARRAFATEEHCPPAGRCHDGFYLRAASGFTGYSEAVISETHQETGEPPEASISGMGTASELALGGTLGRGFVLGGALQTANVLSYSVTVERGESAPVELLRPYQLAIVGPFADWYLNPAAGLHVEAALGLALLLGLEPDRTDLHFRDPGVGGGFSLGFGNEWWFSDEWSLGVLGRLSVAVVGDEDDSGLAFTRVAVAGPALLLSVTCH